VAHEGSGTLFTYPDFDPVALDLGFLQVRWYGLMYVAGFLCGWAGFRARCRKPNAVMTPVQVDDLVFYIMVGVIVGGRVGYMLLYDFGNFVGDPLSLFFIWDGGMSFHGGLLGVISAIWLFARRLGQHFLAVADGVAPWVAPGLGFGRIGNFINGELWGKPTSPEAPWAVIVDGQARHASQLYEATLEGLVMFLILWWYSKQPRPRGAVSGLFLLLYGAFRFAVEFIRVPDSGEYLALGWVTYGQVYSAPMILFGTFLIVTAVRRRSDR
jgi:phosphatidylglycerol:prolipoprotein diacylglycerol transferase